MSKKILFIAPSAYPFGGVADWLDYLLPGLERMGWRCTLGLVTGQHHRVDRYLDRHPFARVCEIANPTGSPEGRVRAIRSAVESTSANVVATINIVDAYDAVRRIRLAGGPDVKVVTTLHGLQEDLLADIASNPDVIDAVISSNRLSQALVVNALSGARARSLYAPYGVVLPSDHSPKSKCAECIRLLYSGRIEQEQKRVLDLPLILSGLRKHGQQVQLVIAGGGPDAATLKAAFERAGVSDCVVWAGILGKDDLAQQYRASDALIITSDWETGPIVAWEAMANRLPVISSAYVGAAREQALVHGENCLLFPVGDVEAAVASVMELHNETLRNRLAQSAYQTVQLRYTQHASVQAWSDAFTQVLQLPPLPDADAAAAQSHIQPPIQFSGRLDRMLGVQLGESVRAALGVAYQHSSAGGEWPHTRQSSANAAAFLARAALVDRQACTDNPPPTLPVTTS
jgi:glycosyltransferase involved in cell wall biosynthesis